MVTPGCTACWKLSPTSAELFTFPCNVEQSVCNGDLEDSQLATKLEKGQGRHDPG